jgi:hypothetical protein
MLNLKLSNILSIKLKQVHLKFNKLEPTVIPNSNYVIRGNEYKAEVF